MPLSIVPIPITNADVNAERDRRILLPKTVSLSTGKIFTCDIDNGGRENIGDMDAAAKTKEALGDTTLIPFRDANNVTHDLTNAEIMEMALQIFAKGSAIHVAGRTLKTMNPIPQNFTSDSYWP